MKKEEKFFKPSLKVKTPGPGDYISQTPNIMKKPNYYAFNTKEKRDKAKLISQEPGPGTYLSIYEKPKFYYSFNRDINQYEPLQISNNAFNISNNKTQENSDENDLFLIGISQDSLSDFTNL